MTDYPHDASWKQCSTCPNSYIATPDFFSRDRTKSDGLRTTCKLCEKARKEAYQQTHKEEIRKRSMLYRADHREECAAYKRQHQQGEQYKQYQRQYYLEHKEQLNEQGRQYYLEHQEEARERQRKYLRSEQGRAVGRAHKHKRKAQKKAVEGSYTSQQLQEQLQRQRSRCYYCKVKLGDLYHVDHIVPLSKDGTNNIDNIVLACPPCNLHKSAKLLHEWNGSGGRLL